MDEIPTEVPVDAEATGYDADVEVREVDDPSTLDFSRMGLPLDVMDDKKDLADLKEASSKVAEVLYVSQPTLSNVDFRLYLLLFESVRLMPLQNLAKRVHKRVDAIHQAEKYRLKAQRLEAKLKKAKEASLE